MDFLGGNTEVFLVFLGIVIFFVFFLVLQGITKLHFCVICASVASTWITLLLLSWFGFFQNTLLIAVLMGGSAVGLLSLFKKKAGENLQIFGLPLLLSLFFLVYVLFGITRSAAVPLVLFLAVLWGLFGFGHNYRRNPHIQKVVDKIIACCKNW